MWIEEDNTLQNLESGRWVTTLHSENMKMSLNAVKSMSYSYRVEEKAVATPNEGVVGVLVCCLCEQRHYRGGILLEELPLSIATASVNWRSTVGAFADVLWLLGGCQS